MRAHIVFTSKKNMLLNIYSWTKNFVGFESIMNKKIDSMIAKIDAINERITKMALNLDTLMAEVERTKGVQDSAILLLKHLADELKEISDKLAATPKEMPVDTSGLDALVEKLKGSTDALADAVAANSHEHPAEPAPVVEEPAPVSDTPVEGNPV